MANRMKDDEKNEKIIRSLLKLPANRKCINCSSLGPQYVCTNFWTFVCTTCSGIHREFTHRVKSISMAKFNSQEVAALQGGGNERAKEIYFKEWDPHRHSLPDGSNVERLRDFIKHVYVDRRYTGERSMDRPPRVQNDRDDSNENRRPDSYRGGSRSPPYEDTYERRYNERSGPGTRNDDRNFRYGYDERRSPGYEQENQRYGDFKRSPASIEVVDDWRREDRFGDHRPVDGAPKPEGRSPNHQKDPDLSSPPTVRPVRDILGDDAPPLRVGDPAKINGSRSADASVRTQGTASSSSMGSADGNSAEVKPVASGSLIDFSDPEPPVAVPQNAPLSGHFVEQPTTTPSIDGGNWASFDVAVKENASQTPSSASTVESALAQLSAPATVPAPAPAGNMSSVPIGGVNSLPRAGDGGQWSNMQQHQPSLFASVSSQSAVQQFTAVSGAAPHNQQWSSLAAPNTQGPSTAASGQLSQAASKLPQEAAAGIPSQPLSAEAKPSGRKELPVDLFTLYNQAPVPVLGWQTAPHSITFGMQYPNPASMPAFLQTSKSTNPFDLTNEPTLNHASSFPSMASLQGALPSMTGQSALLRTSSLGTPSPGWVPTQTPSYPPPLVSQVSPYQPTLPPEMPSYQPSVALLALPPRSPSFRPAIPPNVYAMQQTPSNIPALGHHGVGGFGNEGTTFGPLGASQQPAASYSQSAALNSFPSLGGNPFG